MPPDQLHKLFRKFQQLDSSDTRQKGGTGLGLAISKALVEHHGGTIGVDSRLGEGSVFFFEIPFDEAPESRPSRALSLTIPTKPSSPPTAKPSSPPPTAKPSTPPSTAAAPASSTSAPASTAPATLSSTRASTPKP
jgi:hypothetical protein